MVLLQYIVHIVTQQPYIHHTQLSRYESCVCLICNIHIYNICAYTISD